jgi:hypothetical protein
VLLALWSEFGPHRWKKQRPSQLALGKAPSHHGTVPRAMPADESAPVAEAVPVAEVVEAPTTPARRIGTASHLRSLTLQERLQVLLGQLYIGASRANRHCLLPFPRIHRWAGGAE